MTHPLSRWAGTTLLAVALGASHRRKRVLLRPKNQPLLLERLRNIGVVTRAL